MSDRTVHLDHDKDEIPDKSMRPSQSAWMSHWAHTRYKPIHDAQNQLSLHFESGENSQKPKHNNLVCETEIETGSSKYVKEFRHMHNAITNESLTTGLRKLRHETSKGQHFPMFKSFQNRDGLLSLNYGEPSSHQGGLLRPQIAATSSCDVSLGQTDKCLPSLHELTPSKVEAESVESQLEPEGIILSPDKQVKPKELLQEHRIVISAPCNNEYLGSTSRIMASEFHSERTLTEPFSPMSTSLVHERKVHNNAALLIENPSTSGNQLRDFLGEHIQKMPNHSDIKLFPSQIRPTKARLYYGSSELPRIPSSLRDVESMRICTTIGSVEEFTICPPKFSQATHHFLITKKTDVNLFDGGQMLGDSTTSSNFKEKQPNDLLSPSGFNVKQGVKLQTLDSSTDSEAKENMENMHSSVDLKNESSAETGTMDMDTLQVYHITGVASSISNKDVDRAQKSPTLEAAIALVREESKSRLPNVELPDINQEVPPIPGMASSADDGEASTSKTQSLDVEHFLPRADHPTNSKSSACADALMGLDPYSRWVKRLKLSASDSLAYGTRSSKMGEASSQEKVNKFFSQILNCSKTSSEPKMNKSYGKGPMVADHTAETLKKVESSSTDSVRKSQEITLSHAWIQRWCHKQAASSKKKPEAVVACETQSSKASEDKFQKKQFPSIAAMALMGKAMNGFHPCEFRKRGTFVVWNTKGLP